MTCIVGLVADGKVYIGGDSAGVSSYSLSLVQRQDAKVFRNGDFIFGFTSSFRMGQILRYSFSPPPRHSDADVMQYMVTSFVDALRSALKAGGYAQRVNEVEEAGVFLVGYAGRLFRIDSDYQVGESMAGYDACGCAESVALGAMYANTSMVPAMEPEARVFQALNAAQANSAGVRAPFHVVST